VDVFVSYRRDDVPDATDRLAEALKQRFGSDHVFLDIDSIEVGVEYAEVIAGWIGRCDVLLAVIGPDWVGAKAGREQPRIHDPNDWVRLEIEAGLERRIPLVPVLIHADMPAPAALPASLLPLLGRNAKLLSRGHWNLDVADLIAAIERIGRSRHAAPAPRPVSPETVERVARVPPTPQVRSGPPPPGLHYENVVRYLVDRGTLVPVLGPDVLHSGAGADGVASELARRFDLDVDSRDLAKAVQYALATVPRRQLDAGLGEIFRAHSQPGPVHRFLARFPGELSRASLPPRYQMVVTVNCDAALERAFDEEREPYDLVVHMASGPDRGRFVHIPFDGAPTIISGPQAYGALPIDDDLRLLRTVIVKTHGSVDADFDGYSWRGNYLLSAHDESDYLAGALVESLVPMQLLYKLRASHCLFIGSSADDWRLRVLVKRIWRGRPLDSTAWSVERQVDKLQAEFWRQAQVEVLEIEPETYVSEVSRQMLQPRGVSDPFPSRPRERR
jgi:hypothetical protein